MIEFLRLPFTLMSVWLCFIAAILFIKKYHSSTWRIFPVYLFIVICVEMLVYFGLRLKYITNTQWLYNLFLPVAGLFYFYVFSRLIHLKTVKTILAFAGGIFIISMLSEGLYQGFDHFLFRSYIVLCVLGIGLCIMYFYSLFQQIEYSDLLKDPAFWFAAGSLAFFGIGTSVNIFFIELVSLKIENQIPLRQIIMGITNIIMYGCWIKSFLCLQNNPDYTRQSYSQP